MGEVQGNVSQGGKEGEEPGGNVSQEGQETEEARKYLISEKEGNTTYLSGEVIMESFGSPEEEVQQNTHVTEPHFIPYSSSYPPFLAQVLKPAVMIIMVSVPSF